ncbi:transcriptional regulator, winged helix family [Nakamurella multipartita DSM 44233]|uniref:Transcriptional regulator, winged helix family n=1 Tax=Nakamurella multipartita (strain ATCC 700099 / DSM 44233 / CIP 104796 / JCM 9543 / NBRC 105858 / Y-104) TaxID=479431 RepID=C8XCD2_NAKMY|nr:transcriptional regulator, winged helix family [Nakamurella multipartita DSM 44233]
MIFRSLSGLWDSDEVYVGILGPLQVQAGDGPVPIAGTRLRALLTRLAVAAPEPVSVAELVQALWPGEPPGDPTNALQSLVSRVRRALGDAARIEQVPGGYRLTVEGAEVDAAVFGELVATGRRELQRDRPAQAQDLLTRALSLWRGEPLADAADGPYATATRARLQELRLDAQVDLIEAQLRLGRSADVIADLEQLVATHPLRERLAAQLMRALAATGRQADALAVYERLRDRLAGELGVDPGADTQSVHLAVLRGEIAAEPAVAPAANNPLRRRTNLRAPLTRLIGRDAQVRRITDLLADGRLVTVVGPGGAGKTRLAQEVGRTDAAARPDGVWLVELASVTEPKGIGPAMIGALGLLDTRAVDRRSDRAARDSIEYLIDVLAEADCLLVLDNCEHLVAAVADLVDALLAASPRLRVLATSREPLGIVGESLCLVPPLGLPPVGATAAEAAGYPAVRLLVERGHAVTSEFEVSPATVEAVVEIVRRLDGLPLAIELAAARLRVMPVGEIAARLSDRFRLLTGGSRTALPRHRTLRAVVEWSWELLRPAERLLAERLAVFPAGATPAAAAAVCGDARLPGTDVADLMLSLVDKSLLTVTGGSVVRYRMLETIREYGVERLADRGEAAAARAAHARYYAALAGRTDPLLRTGEQLAAIAALNDERDNIVAAVHYLADSADPADRRAALALVLHMSWYWQMTGATAEASGLLAVAMAATADDEQDPLRPWAQALLTLVDTFAGVGASSAMADFRAESGRIARALLTAGPPPSSWFAMVPTMLALFANDADLVAQAAASSWATDPWTRAALAMGRALFAENEGRPADMRADIDLALAGFEAIGDRWGQSSVLSSRGNLRATSGDIDGGIADYERALTLSRELGAAEDEAMIQLRLAGLLMRAGDLRRAQDLVAQVHDPLDERTPGFDRRLFAAGMQAMISLLAGDLAGAQAQATQLRGDWQRRGADPLQSHAVAFVVAATAVVAVHAGDVDTAVADVRTGYPIALRTEDMPVVATLGVAVAWVAAAVGHPDRAAVALGASARLRGSDDPGDPVVARLIARLRGDLGEAYAEHYGRGGALTRAGAVEAIDPDHALGR